MYVYLSKLLIFASLVFAQGLNTQEYENNLSTLTINLTTKLDKNVSICKEIDTNNYLDSSPHALNCCLEFYEKSSNVCKYMRDQLDSCNLICNSICNCNCNCNSNSNSNSITKITIAPRYTNHIIIQIYSPLSCLNTQTSSTDVYTIKYTNHCIIHICIKPNSLAIGYQCG